MTNSQSPQTELADGIFSDEALMQAELHRLYNFIDDDSRQFTRWQMGVAMLHGYNLASRPSPLVDTAEALREALEDARKAFAALHVDCDFKTKTLAKIDAALAAHPKPEENQ